uniref:Uncharacterized protein n=1 Tax=Arundo donax TaxID=35708 RepID=A0A0A8ZRQ2_ARUDO
MLFPCLCFFFFSLVVQARLILFFSFNFSDKIRTSLAICMHDIKIL